MEFCASAFRGVFRVADPKHRELFAQGHTASWWKAEINDGALGSSYLVVSLVLPSIAQSFYLCVVWNFEGCSSGVSDLGAIESIEVRLINPGLRQVFAAENGTKCLLMTQVGIVWK